MSPIHLSHPKHQTHFYLWVNCSVNDSRPSLQSQESTISRTHFLQVPCQHASVLTWTLSLACYQNAPH